MPETECGFDDVTGIATGSALLISQGPTVRVDIGFDANWKPGPTASTPIPAIKDVDALVDTGAGECCIDDLLANQLKLPVFDEREVSGVGGKLKAKMYLAQIRVPSLEFIMYGAFAGVHLIAGGQVHQALIGRTFLRYFNMTYEGTTGKVRLVLR